MNSKTVMNPSPLSGGRALLIALYPSDGATPDTLYANAEAALKKAKATGEPFLFYAPEMNSRIAESLTLENKLRNALEQEQFVLYYQPKVTVQERTITGLEALIRWRDPELGLVPPLKFIPLMEETGLILEAGRWALSQVARDNAIWVADGLRPPRVAVNVSPIQLRQKNFIDIVVEAAQKAQEAGGMLAAGADSGTAAPAESNSTRPTGGKRLCHREKEQGRG